MQRARDRSASAAPAAATSITETIGNTPLLALDSLAERVHGKVEGANPYSVKDRIALAMVEAAEADGALASGGTVVEATSGNTGIGLAAVSAAKGYDCVLTMPTSMSEERRRLLAALGADLELTPADDGMGGAIERADELVADHDDAVRARQFENEANPRVHRETTGPEIYDQTDGEVDAVVAGVGTGGTITGVTRALREDRDADVTAVAVEPEASQLLSADEPDSHGIQGIGPGFVPDILDRSLIDEVRTVAEDDAKATARALGRKEGLLVGISAGAAAAAARAYAADNPDETVVTILPDGGERYLSTDLFE